MVDIGDMKDEFVKPDKLDSKGKVELEGNVKSGDKLTIVSAGERDTEGEYGERLIVDVVVNGDEDEALKYSLNKTSLRAAASAWGDDTDNWVGGELLVNVTQSMVQGTLKNVVYTEPVAAEEQAATDEKETPAAKKTPGK